MIKTKEDFKIALLKLRDNGKFKNTKYLDMLRAQYVSENHTITAARLAESVGYKNYNAANLQYGRLGHEIADAIDYTPPNREDGSPMWFFALSTGNEASEKTTDGHYEFVMREELAEALEELRGETDFLRWSHHKVNRVPVSFEKLQIGQKYERPFLADLWGYKGFQAISRGVVTPSETKLIILFVTKEKQEALTQYNDHIDGKTLYWEGEKKHTSDSRVINAASVNDEIHLFYRDIHHSPFVYYGNVFLKEYKILTSEPSQFAFLIGRKTELPDPFDDIESYQNEFKLLSQTEKESIVKSRIGQGQFRSSVIELWDGCAVTGLNNISLLRASHIKPWRDSSNQERLDPMNGLLLQPTLDHLFDLGLITFGDDGKIQISSKLSQDDIKTLNISSDSKLRIVPRALLSYMAYHRKHVFTNN
jgi:predicted restriction endonuclease